MLKTFRPNVGRPSKSFRGRVQERLVSHWKAAAEKQGLMKVLVGQEEQGHPEA